MTVIRNSTAAVDFNKEVEGYMHNTASANGRELKLAVAIYNDPATFNIADLLGGVGSKSRSVGMRRALTAHSEAFKRQSEAAALKRKASETKSMKGYAAKAEYEAAAKTLTAAVSMFERALTAAYFFKCSGAVIEKVTDKTVKLRTTREVTIGKGDKAATYEAGLTDLFTRKSVYECGRSLGNAAGIFSTRPTERKAAGTGVATGTQSTVLAASTTLAETVAKLPSKERDDIVASAEFQKSAFTMIRAMCVADGTLKVSELVEMLRKSDAMQGVNIDVDVSAPRQSHKPVAKAA